MKARQAGIRALLWTVLAVVGWNGSDASLKIFDIGGRLVRTLAEGHLAAGRHLRTWDGMTTGGSRARSGVYFYRLEARSADGLEVRRRKAILVE